MLGFMFMLDLYLLPGAFSDNLTFTKQPSYLMGDGY